MVRKALTAALLLTLLAPRPAHGDAPDPSVALEHELASARAAGRTGPAGVALARLGQLRMRARDFAAARSLFEQAVASLRAAYGRTDARLIEPLRGLADLAGSSGDNNAALRYRQAILFITEVPGRKLEVVRAQTLRARGDLYAFKLAQFQRGHQEMRLAAEVLEQVLAENPGDLGAAATYGALVETTAVSPEKGEPYLRRALAASEGKPGQELTRSVLLEALGELTNMKDDKAGAIALKKQALQLREQVLGRSAPSLHSLLQWLAIAGDDPAESIEYQRRALDLSDAALASLLALGTSETAKRNLLADDEHELRQTLSLHFMRAPTLPAAGALGLRTVLRRKGLAVDTMGRTLRAARVRHGIVDAALMHELVLAHSELAALVHGPRKPHDHATRLQAYYALLGHIDGLEAEIASRGAKVSPRPLTTVDDVRRHLPPATALIEMVRWTPNVITEHDFGPHYAAYVLSDRGLAWVDLGLAEPIEQQVRAFQVALRDPRDAGVQRAGRALDAQLMEPIRKLLGRETQLLIAPDGLINLIPFEALVDPSGKFLVQRYDISYLTSGRSLLELGSAGKPRSKAVVFADPRFQNGAAPAVCASRRMGGVTLEKAVFCPLPGTADEGAGVARLLGVHALTGAAATEAALRAVHGPAILHIATHGFFLDDSGEGSGRGLELTAAHKPAPQPVDVDTEDQPLLRSGLALAGANQRNAGDGIVTSLEAADLDLVGTQLVVLSACETGTGVVSNGEGVFGLRRALELAGAQSMVMSLWKVDDRATQGLMLSYYQKLAAGAGTAAALRQAQLALIARPERAHPYFWAAFVHIGDWRPMAARTR